jgi:hypothetical protein
LAEKRPLAPEWALWLLRGHQQNLDLRLLAHRGGETDL